MPQYRKLKIWAPMAMAARGAVRPRWPMTAVSATPSRGTATLATTMGAAMTTTSRALSDSSLTARL